MSIPDFVQNTYTRLQQNGLPGSLADGNPTFINSFVADSEVNFGRVISLGKSYGPPVHAVQGGASVSATAGYFIGSPITSSVAAFNAVTTGSVIINIDGSAVTLTGLDFSAVTDFAGVATVITTALTTNGTCTFDSASQTFKVTSATTGSSSKIGAITDASTGTSILALMGWNTVGIRVDGIAARSAVVLGVCVRSLSAAAKSIEDSKTTVVKAEDVGAYLTEGTIKVLAKETVAGGATVYFDDVTGEIYGSSATGRTALGSSKWVYPCAEGQVGVIDVVGVR